MHTAQILGRLTRDPELRSLPDGTPVCDLRVAVTGMGRGNDTGYIDVSVFGASAETQATYLAKGREVVVAGDLRFHEYQAGDGSKRSQITLVARTVDWTRGTRREDQAEEEGSSPEPASEPVGGGAS